MFVDVLLFVDMLVIFLEVGFRFRSYWSATLTKSILVKSKVLKKKSFLSWTIHLSDVDYVICFWFLIFQFIKDYSLTNILIHFYDWYLI